MTIEQQELWKRIQPYQIDDCDSEFTLTMRLSQENNWSLEYAQRVIQEYKKFTFLAIASGHKVTPSIQVDQAWHLHLLYTRDYWNDFCKKVLGFELHHGPTKGGQQEDAKFEDWYMKTMESYERLFGEKPPVDIWPSCEERFSVEQRFVQLNVPDYLIVKKSDYPIITKLFTMIMNMIVTINQTKINLMKKFTFVMALIVSVVTFASAQMPQFPSQPMLDLTGSLQSSQVQHLNQKVEDYEKKTGMEIRLVYVTDVSPYATASDYAMDLYHTWKLGDKLKHNGLLLVIAQRIGSQSNDMKDYCRIVTGWGVTTIVPDDVVINDVKHGYMMPQLPQQPFLAFDNSLDRLFYHIDEWRANHPEDATVNSQESDSNVWIWVLVIAVIIVVFVISMAAYSVSLEKSSSSMYSSYDDTKKKNSRSSYSSGSSSSGCSSSGSTYIYADSGSSSSSSSSSGCSSSSCGSSCGGGGCGGGGCGS